MWDIREQNKRGSCLILNVEKHYASQLLQKKLQQWGKHREEFSISCLRLTEVKLGHSCLPKHEQVTTNPH